MDTAAELYPELPDDVRALVQEREELASFALRVPRRNGQRWWQALMPQKRPLWWCAMIRDGANGHELRTQVRPRFPQAAYEGGRCLWLRPVRPDETGQ